MLLVTPELAHVMDRAGRASLWEAKRWGPQTRWERCAYVASLMAPEMDQVEPPAHSCRAYEYASRVIAPAKLKALQLPAYQSQAGEHVERLKAPAFLAELVV
jgi:hypothetical protein